MTIIDVRTEPEYKQQHAEGAINFELQRIMSGELPPIGKDEEIVLYCNSGNRSGVARQIMQQAGYSNVSNAGGLNDLAREGHKIIS